VLSEAAAALVREALPWGAALRDLGTHRLRDLRRPDRVFQLLHPDLPADFPPLGTLDARPSKYRQPRRCQRSTVSGPNAAHYTYVR
jgi:hypothetical protein